MKRFTGLFAVILLFTGCATFNVSYDFDPEAEFSLMKTYDWSPVQGITEKNELTVKQVKFAVNNQLKAKGFRLTSDKPDMLISVHTGKEKKVEREAWGYQYGDIDYYYAAPVARGPFLGAAQPSQYAEYRQGVDTFEYELGTLILDFIDAKQNSLVWHGTVTGVIDPERRVEQINEAIAKMLENFPPMKTK